MKALDVIPPPFPPPKGDIHSYLPPSKGNIQSQEVFRKAKNLPLWRGQGGGKTPPFTFLNVGLIHPMKQQMQRRIYTQKMRQFCKKNNLENKVEILGYVPNPSEIYAQSDALLMCSLYEGMGRVTAEAMVYGLPVIGLRSGATPELVQHDESGLIYDGDEQDLMSQMEYLILHQNEAKEMGARGHEMALATFTTEKYVEEIWNIVARLNLPLDNS